LGWTPARRVLAAAVLGGILASSALIPAAALQFNEEGHRAYMAGAFERAETMHALAVGLAPDHPVLLDNLGMVYLDEFTKTQKPEHLEYAKRAFEASIAANPIFDIPLGHLETALIHSLTGDIQMDRPIHENIVLTDRRLLAVNPFNPFIRRNLAEALYNLGDRGAAERELREATAIEPNYVPGYLRLAQWRGEAGDRGESEELTARAIAIVTRFRDRKADPFEALLLGRPEATP
jgi:tetratricopeptide (TPR) repeat protein